MVVNCEQVWHEISNFIEGEVDAGLRAAMDDRVWAAAGKAAGTERAGEKQAMVDVVGLAGSGGGALVVCGGIAGGEFFGDGAGIEVGARATGVGDSSGYAGGGDGGCESVPCGGVRGHS